jgi:cbb3-type cytochrome oxidase cytochrome c subunit
MRTGEKGILLVILVLVGGGATWNFLQQRGAPPEDREIPFYSTASVELRQAAGDLYRRENCKSCHTLWTIRDIMRSVPAPALDGIGSLHDEQWFFDYFSADNPQQILPSRLKAEYQMPSYAHLPENERQMLAAYMASLKVKDWYLDEAREARCRKLTGEDECP